jgi:exopolysaccharide production protein ExoZ
MPKLGGLQFLRAFAAIMVLIGHAIAEAEHYFAISLHLDFIPWTRGVDIFFVISGFIITLSATRYKGRPFAFLQRRVMRVVPLYYVFTTLMVFTVFFFPNGPKDTVFDLSQILSSYGFFPYARLDGRIAPILSLGWTLNYEIFFTFFAP